VILSELKSVEKVREYYDRVPDLVEEIERRREDREAKLTELTDASKGVPPLL